MRLPGAFAADGRRGGGGQAGVAGLADLDAAVSNELGDGEANRRGEDHRGDCARGRDNGAEPGRCPGRRRPKLPAAVVRRGRIRAGPGRRRDECACRARSRRAPRAPAPSSGAEPAPAAASRSGLPAPGRPGACAFPAPASTAPIRRRAAAIIARRSGSLFDFGFEVRFAGPARAFFCADRGSCPIARFCPVPFSSPNPYLRNHGTQLSPREDPQHRDHGAHRRR